MSVYIVTYDLRAPGRNYDALYDALNSFESCHCLESVWFIDSQHDSKAIRDHLQQFIDKNDGLFVGQISRNWAGVSMACGDWLNDDSRVF